MNDTDVIMSVIVTIYNSEMYLERCISSIVSQLTDKMELVLVDDGSTDGSLAICNRFRDGCIDRRIVIIHKKNGGCISARNEGIANAVGEYIGFVDADDYINAGCLERVYNDIIKYKVDIIAFDNINIYENGDIVKDNMIAEEGLYDKTRLKEELYPRLLYSGTWFYVGFSPSLCNKYIKRELIREFEAKVDERISSGEDVACSYGCIMKADSLFYDKGFFGYTYVIRNDSMEQSWNEKDAFRIVVLMDYLVRLSDEYLLDEYKDQILYYAAFQYCRVVGLFLKKGFWLSSNRKKTAYKTYNLICESNSGDLLLNSLNELKELPSYNRALLKYMKSPTIYNEIKLLVKKIRKRLC